MVTLALTDQLCNVYHSEGRNDATLEALSYCRLLPPRQIAKLLLGKGWLVGAWGSCPCPGE